MVRAGHILALCVIALLTIGVVMVNSAQMSISRATITAPAAPSLSVQSILLSRHTIYMLMALAAMGVGASLPVRRFVSGLRSPDAPRDPILGLLPLAIGGGILLLCCGLVYVPGLGAEINGAHRWLRFPIPGLGDGLSVQPSEIAKWGMIPLLAWYCWSRGRQLGAFWLGIIPVFGVLGAVSGLIVLEDLGTGVLIAGVGCALLMAGGATLWHLMLTIPVGMLGVGAAILTSDYRRKRILAFIDPFEDPRGIGYHTVQSLVSVSSGQGFGRGLGHGLNKFGFLPESPSDFIFAVVCEELGIAGAAMVCALFAAVVAAGMLVARRETQPMLRLFCFGVTCTIGLQAIINLAVVTGLAPNKGIALPLLSAGGTGWILTAFSIGLMVAVDRTRVDVPEPGAEQFKAARA